jgi:hypothetical protein
MKIKMGPTILYKYATADVIAVAISVDEAMKIFDF